ncbi:MAG TPA: primosomal protein N', partial [Flavobacteriales bacterium]|nr:primosomal protein N' [Flavobacteriales bacterium]
KKHRNKPLHYDTKPILHIIDNRPIITEHQWQLFKFISSYYLTPLGLVFKAALPATFMLESETYLMLNDADLPRNDLSDEEYMIIEALDMQKMVNVKSLQELFDGKNVFGLVNLLMKKGFVKSLQEVKEKYKPKTETYIQLSDEWQGENINRLFDNLSKNAPKQRLILLQFFSLQRQGRPVPKKQLLEKSGASGTSLKSLVDKGVFFEIKTNIDRINFEAASEEIKGLSPDQQKALEDIRMHFINDKPVLLHGVTSSGKTEVYIHLIKETITQQKQVLYLVPEIALTTQLVQRLTKIFGNDISVYHSKYSQQERREVWMNVLQKQTTAKVILAARSGIFLPFQNLGLIIVDEEHEPSYKQVQPAPRYQARDLAVLLSRIHQSPILLGSATPSIETYYNTQRQRYALTNLHERFGGVQLPDIKIIDLKEALKRKRVKGHFSEVVLEQITASLQQKKQVIVFQNRRGYAPVAQCEDCGHVMECPHCDVSLTLHKHQHKLKCHYCGYHIEAPMICPVCGNPSINYKGVGTEQIQNDLQVFFPEAIIDRLDSDTTRGKNSFANILSKFQNLETDILVGTQMLVKGLDFANVGLVVVMNADQLLFYPDFRADERSFQMLMQVAGRAGRQKEQGKVMIQTYNPDHPVLQMVLEGDYQKMYDLQINQRRELFYPPFSKMINFQLKDRNLQKVMDASEWLYRSFANSFEKVLGPSDALIPRIKDKYIKEILIKLPPSKSLPEQKKQILKILNTFHNIAVFKSVQVIIDVDPY